MSRDNESERLRDRYEADAGDNSADMDRKMKAIADGERLWRRMHHDDRARYRSALMGSSDGSHNGNSDACCVIYQRLKQYYDKSNDVTIMLNTLFTLASPTPPSTSSSTSPSIGSGGDAFAYRLLCNYYPGWRHLFGGAVHHLAAITYIQATRGIAPAISGMLHETWHDIGCAACVPHDALMKRAASWQRIDVKYGMKYADAWLRL